MIFIFLASNENLLAKAKDFATFVESSTSSSPVQESILLPNEVIEMFKNLRDLFHLFSYASKSTFHPLLIYFFISYFHDFMTFFKVTGTSPANDKLYGKAAEKAMWGIRSVKIHNPIMNFIIIFFYHFILDTGYLMRNIDFVYMIPSTLCLISSLSLKAQVAAICTKALS